MASPNEPWTLAGGKKNKPQNTHASSKGKKKTFAENMPRIEPSRKLLSDVLVVGVSHNERYAALSPEAHLARMVFRVRVRIRVRFGGLG